jgi:pyruvate dehydrogenase E2 component (dihydrolipoamide acetyltransferase)
MARPVRMPPLGATSDELRVVQWLKEVGAAVAQGELLLEVETDKATLEVEAAVAGTLLAVLHGPGETIAVGETLGWIGAPGEEIPAERKQAVPVARKLAQEHGIDLASVQGSGPGGRIEKRDVLALVEAPQGEIELSRHRRAAAERLTRSVQTIPQFSVGVDVEMTSAAARLADGPPGLTYTHLLLQATAGALRDHPEVNRLWVAAGPRLLQLERADVGLAVAGEDTLLVPTIAEPDLLGLPELVAATDEAVRLARDGRLTATPVSITLSNLGMFGVDRFTAIVDPDQTAILAVGAVRERVELTLTVDHRVVDGVLAARFLATIQARLES